MHFIFDCGIYFPGMKKLMRLLCTAECYCLFFLPFELSALIFANYCGFSNRIGVLRMRIYTILIQPLVKSRNVFFIIC